MNAYKSLMRALIAAALAAMFGSACTTFAVSASPAGGYTIAPRGPFVPPEAGF